MTSINCSDLRRNCQKNKLIFTRQDQHYLYCSMIRLRTKCTLANWTISKVCVMDDVVTCHFRSWIEYAAPLSAWVSTNFSPPCQRCWRKSVVVKRALECWTLPGNCSMRPMRWRANRLKTLMYSWDQEGREPRWNIVVIIFILKSMQNIVGNI